MKNNTCFLCLESRKWEVRVDNDLRFSDAADWKSVCEYHVQHILLEQKEYIRRPEVESLNEAYVDQTRAYSFARCPNCHSIFKDDVMLFGSLQCPNRECEGFALERGIKSLDD